MHRGPDSAGTVSRWSRIRRALPIDAVALIVIAVAILFTQRALGRRGLCFNDPTWYFHFGHRTALGDVPYRDYVFQVGPLPIYVDALAQGVFGGVYAASLYAAMLIKILRVFVIWAIARRLAGVPVALGLAVFCALDPLFSFAHHWSTAYAHLFISLSGLCFVHAARDGGLAERTRLVYLALAGLTASLVVSARQSSAVMIGIALLAASAVMAVRREYFTRRRLAALWIGFAAGLALVFGALAIAGALGPAIQQMFLDAPQKKGIHGIPAILDAISGGALVIGGDVSWWGGFLTYLGLPVVFIAAIFALAVRDEPLSLGSVAVVAVPAAIVLGLLTRYAQLNFFSDVPRTFLSAVVALAVVFPDRLRSWFGLEPLIAVGLGALPLASDWALEMSYPGRGWGDAPALTIGVILLALASRHIAPRGKVALCAALAAIAVSGTLAMLGAHVNPFAKDSAGDGTLQQTTQRSRNHRLRGIRINDGRARVLDWLMRSVPIRSTCFVYGNLPVLYTLLSCHNPTRIDTTAADFVTAQDAADAIAVLKAHPPDYLIAHDSTWMNPPLALDLGGDVTRYDGTNPAASRALHVGLRELLAQYEQIGFSGDLLTPETRAIAEQAWDRFDTLRVYRRKAP